MLHIFETITYNQKTIRFRDDKDFCETLLQELGVPYTDLAFFFSSGDTDCITRYCPALQPYIQRQCLYPESTPETVFSSVRAQPDGDISLYLSKELYAEFDKCLKKIPRPINFGFMTVLLDHVHWYGSETQPPIYPHPKAKLLQDLDFFHYHSNSIRFRKEFDWGNRYNLIQFQIDRTGKDEQLRPYPASMKKLLDKLGKPFHQRISCIFEPEENERFDRLHTDMKARLADRPYAQWFRDVPQSFEKQLFQAELTPLSGISPKSILTQVAKGTGFHYAGCNRGTYQFVKENACHHRFEICFFIPPLTSCMWAEIQVCGYNFQHLVCQSPEIAIQTEEDMFRLAQSTFEIEPRIEHELTDELLTLYGKTPEWYFQATQSF